MYRRTKKYSEARARQLEAMRRGRDRARMAREPSPRAVPLPLLRKRITVENFDFGHERHVFELRRDRGVDSYWVYADGRLWRKCGLTKVLEGLRKACPRVASARSLA